MERYPALIVYFPCTAKLRQVRRLTPEEKLKYTEECRDFLFYPADGEEYEFENKIEPCDFPDRKSDGEWHYGSNKLWIISQDEWDNYIAVDRERTKIKSEKKRVERLAYLERAKSAAEKQTKLYTLDEAKRVWKKYNDTYNEGGYGYVPHYYTDVEYEQICAEIEKLKSEGGPSEQG